MRKYTVTAAADIITYATSAKYGDLVYVPAGTWDISSIGPLAFTSDSEGATWVGAGRGKTIIKGRVTANLAGSLHWLCLSDLTIDSVLETTLGPKSYGPNEFMDGNYILSNVEITGSAAGNAITFVADSTPCRAIMSRCVAHNSTADVISTKGETSDETVSSSSWLLLLGCEAYTPGAGAATYQCLTSHGTFRITDLGGYYHDAVAGQTIAQASGTCPIRMYGSTITHAGTNACGVVADVLYRCTLTGTATALTRMGVTTQASKCLVVDSLLDVYGNGISYLTHNVGRNGGIKLGYSSTYPSSSAAITYVRGNLMQDRTGSSAAGITVAENYAGTAVIEDNIARNCVRNFQFREDASPTILFRGNLSMTPVSAGYAVFQYDGASGTITWSANGGYNHLQGTLSTNDGAMKAYSLLTGDVITLPAPSEVAAWTGRIEEVGAASYDRSTLDSAIANVETWLSARHTGMTLTSAYDAAKTAPSASAIRTELEGAETKITATYTVAAGMTGQVTALVNRLGGWAGEGVNTVLGAFQALLRKDATLPSDIGGTFSPATDSVEAVQESLSADGLTLDQALTAMMAVITGVAEVDTTDADAPIVTYKKRDGSTAAIQITYSTTDGVRTASVIP